LYSAQRAPIVPSARRFHRARSTMSSSARQSASVRRPLTVLLVQPFGVESPGGGGRVFRSLCEGVSTQVVSACVGPFSPRPTEIVEELYFATRPRLARLRASRLGVLVRQLDDVGHRGVERELEAFVRQRGIAAIHALADAHISFAIAHRVARRTGARFVLSLWDAPWYKRLRVQAGNRRYFRALGEAWRDADARTVISAEMGSAFCSRYGRKPFVVVTDGLASLAADPIQTIPSEFTIYFCGSIHLAHWDNFRILAEAVDRVRRSHAWRPRIVLRGSTFPGASESDFVDTRPWDATDAEVTAEVAAADILYLPLPFGDRYAAFTGLSLPTKLVTYLGSGRPILYHGPAETAAAGVLRDAGAALLLAEQDPVRLADALVRWVESSRPAACAARALELARARFTRERQQRLFWEAVLGDRVDELRLAGEARRESLSV
jgi:glycosyltransferase involved in cell wall biosynthesis